MAPPRQSLALRIVVCVLAMEALGGAGAFVTRDAIATWYADLIKPPGTPPNWLFGPVWTALYAAIGVSFALVWHRIATTGGPRGPLGVFFFQLALNLAWTPVFFGAHRITAALVIIVALLAAIVLTIRAFAGISKPAAWLLVPYLCWVGYATYLNAGYAVLNP